MKLIQFLTQETSFLQQKDTWTIAFIAALSNTLLLNLINSASQAAVLKRIETEDFLLYLATLTLLILSKKYTLAHTITLMENALHKLQLRLITKIHQLPNTQLPNTKLLDLQYTVLQDFYLISRSTLNLSNAVLAMLVLLFIFLYIAWLSILAFSTTLLSMLLIFALLSSKRRIIFQETQHQMQKEQIFSTLFTQHLQGLRNPTTDEATYKRLQILSQQTQHHKINIGFETINLRIFSDMFFYTHLAMVLFFMPSLFAGNEQDIIQMTILILFMIGYASSIIQSIPTWNQVELAITRIYELETQLDQLIPQKQ